MLRIAPFFLLLAGSIAAQTGPLTDEQIVNLHRGGLTESELLQRIASATAIQFDLSPAWTDYMLKAGVTENAIKAMAARESGTASGVTVGVSAVTKGGDRITADTVSGTSFSPQSASRAEIASQSSASLTNDSLVKLVKAGVGEDAIEAIVNSQPGQYSVSPESLIALKQAGVSDKIIAAVVNRNGVGTRFINAKQPSSAETLILHDGTPVRLRLTRNLSSADAKTGDTVDFEVLDDVKANDVLVIARGASAIATVTQAQSKRRMARGGKLDISIDYVRLINGEKVALKAVKDTSGGGHTGAMTGAIVATSLVVWPAAPFFLFMHGKDSEIPKNTEITAYINGEVKLDRQQLLVQK